MAPFNYERAGAALAEAAFYGDTQAAEHFGISIRSIQRYRKRLKEDDKLASVVVEKKRILEEAWADELPGAIGSAVEFLHRAGKEADPTDPDAIHSVAGALKILSQVAMTRKVIDARLSKADRPSGPGA